MSDTTCYAMVRGSAIRVTALDRKGTIPDNIGFVTSKSVIKVAINEVTDSGSSQLLGSDENDNDNRVNLSQSDQTLYYTADIDFLRVDPYMLNMVAGVPLVRKDLGPGFGKIEFGDDTFGGNVSAMGFGGDGFGDAPFGEDGDDVPFEDLLVIGFDAVARTAPVSFGLEVWTKLAGAACVDNQRPWGYTVFPHLRGGRMTGFEFANGLVSFNVRGAQTRRSPRWGVGPYDLTGVHERLLTPVSRNTMFRQTLTPALPPMEVDGIQEFEDIIDGNDGSDEVIDGNDDSPWIIDGGAA